MFRFRYKLSEILMIIGIILGIVAVVHLLSVVFLLMSSKDAGEYQNNWRYWIYSSEISDVSHESGALSYTAPHEMKDISFSETMQVLRENGAYTEITIPMPVGGSVDDRKIIGITEVSKYPHELKNGSWSCEKEEGNGLVWIGESWEPYTRKEAGNTYFLIDSLPYRVQGVLDNALTGGMDETIILYIPSCSEIALVSIEKRFNESMRDIGDVEVSFCFDGEEQVMKEEELLSALSKTGLSAMKSLAVYHSEKDESGKLYLPVLALTIVLFVFSAINLYVISSFYFSARSPELCIRKTFGFSGRALFRMLFSELCGKFLIALFLTVPIEFLLVLCGSNLAIRLSDWPRFIAVSTVSFILLILFIAVRFLLLFRRIRPTDLLTR